MQLLAPCQPSHRRLLTQSQCASWSRLRIVEPFQLYIDNRTKTMFNSQMSCVLSKADYLILQKADKAVGGARYEDTLYGVLNRNGCANWTVCPECCVDDFSHVEGCSLIPNDWRNNPRYPSLVCYDCGIRAAKKQGLKPFTISTYHLGTCGVCGEEKGVTETRDFNYPDFPQ